MKASGVYCVQRETAEGLPPEVDIYIAENISVRQFYLRGHCMDEETPPEEIPLPEEAGQKAPEYIGTKPAPELAIEINPWTTPLIQYHIPGGGGFEDFVLAPIGSSHLYFLMFCSTAIACYDTRPRYESGRITATGEPLWREHREAWLENGPREPEAIPEQLPRTAYILFRLAIKQMHGARRHAVDDIHEGGDWGIGERHLYTRAPGDTYYVVENFTPHEQVTNLNECIALRAQTEYENIGDSGGEVKIGVSGAERQLDYVSRLLGNIGVETAAVHSKYAEHENGIELIYEEVGDLRGHAINILTDEYDAISWLTSDEIADFDIFTP